MVVRKSLIASSIAAIVFSMSGAIAAPFESSNAGVAVQPSFPAPNGTAVVLYDQTDAAAGNGAPVQNFEAGFEIYDNEAADDFVVPASGWTVSSFNMVTTLSVGGLPAVTTASVNIYPDAGGLPGAAPTCSYPAATADVGATSTTITLPSDCALTAGSYWFAVSVDFVFATNGQVFWSNRVTQSNSASVWRNPGDGFGTGCPDWTAQQTCGVGGGAGADYLYQVVGVAGGGGVPAEPARELPTLSQWSALLAAGGLALLGMFGMRRRSRR